MASYKRISEDVIRQVITVEEREALQKYHKLQKEVRELGDELKETKRKQERLSKDTEEWKEYENKIKTLNKRLKESKEELNKTRDSLSVNAMTMAQLRHIARDLTRQLDNMSAAAAPEEYAKLSQRLAEVKNRMSDLNMQTKYLQDTMMEGDAKGYLLGMGIEEIIKRGIGMIGQFKEKIIDSSIEMARQADGVSRAFRAIVDPNLLDNLRKATKGTVSDLDLMKAAVQAKDFRIPLEDLGKYLAFAQLKAQQTGQSVSKLSSDIVTGLGRKSKQILDNLGLSAAEIDEKMQETGDFTKAVASIIENQLAAAGDTYVSAADRATQKTVALQNAQQALGEALLPLQEAYAETFGGVQVSLIKATTYLLTHRKAMLLLTVAATGLGVAMVTLNAQVKAYIAQTKLAKAATILWQTAKVTWKGIVLLCTAALQRYNAAIALHKGNTIAAAAATTRATAAMRLFNMTCRANVILAIATALIAATAAFVAFTTRNKQAGRATTDFLALHKRLAGDIKQQDKDIQQSASETVAGTTTKLAQLRKTVNDTTASLDKRKAAIAELQRVIPGYHASIQGEGKLYEQNTKHIDEYIAKLKQAALAEAAYERIKQNNQRIIDAQMSIDQKTQNIRNVKRNAKRKTGIDLDEMNIDDEGMVRYNDVHDQGGQTHRCHQAQLPIRRGSECQIPTGAAAGHSPIQRRDRKGKGSGRHVHSTKRPPMEDRQGGREGRDSQPDH